MTQVIRWWTLIGLELLVYQYCHGESLTVRVRQGGMCRCRSRERVRHGDVMAVMGNVTSGEWSGGGDDWGPWDGWWVSLVYVGSSCRRTACGRERIMCMCIHTQHMSFSPRAFKATRPHASLPTAMFIHANQTTVPTKQRRSPSLGKLVSFSPKRLSSTQPTTKTTKTLEMTYYP